MLALVRVTAEINLKSDYVRRQFMAKLFVNMREAFERQGHKAWIRNTWSRLYVDLDSADAANTLANVFGVYSYSLVDHQCDPNVETMVEVAKKYYSEKVKGKTFAVRAHRGDVKGFTSLDVAKAVGAALRPLATKVDLTNPEVEIFIDIRKEGAFFFSENKFGPSGLPVGVQGRALALISGGFDSAVAAWMMMKRGVALDFVFCNLAGEDYKRSVLAVAKTFAQKWAYGYSPRFYSVDFAPIMKDIKEKVIPKYSQVVLKQAMYKVANLVATHVRAKALVTGEAMGQVSSQTLYNLAAIDPSSELVVFRPLIGFDKQEIIDLSKKVGTFSLSQSVTEYCQIVKTPITQGKVEKVRMQLERMDQSLFDQAFDSMTSVSLNEVSDESIVPQNLFIDKIPEGCRVIDCREKLYYDAWHYPKADRLDIDDLLTKFKVFDKKNTYVLYCPYGLQSAVAAEQMQKAGFSAYSFLGGTRALKSYATNHNL